MLKCQGILCTFIAHVRCILLTSTVHITCILRPLAARVICIPAHVSGTCQQYSAHVNRTRQLYFADVGGTCHLYLCTCWPHMSAVFCTRWPHMSAVSCTCWHDICQRHSISSYFHASATYSSLVYINRCRSHQSKLRVHIHNTHPINRLRAQTYTSATTINTACKGEALPPNKLPRSSSSSSANQFTKVIIFITGESIYQGHHLHHWKSYLGHHLYH